jgi:hypothetical protein
MRYFYCYLLICIIVAPPLLGQTVLPQSVPTTRGTEPGFRDSAVVQASKRYSAGKYQGWLLGRNYRREWQQPVRVAVLDLGQAYGGLTPVRQGGGLQTKSLRLRASDGRQYVLRSVDKNTDPVLPPDLRGTVAARVVQDQISAAHPYAALAIPPLAEAAGVGHTAPRLVLVPDNEQLASFARCLGARWRF